MHQNTSVKEIFFYVCYLEIFIFINSPT